MVEFDSDAVARIRAVLQAMEQGGQGVDTVRRPIREIAEQQGWEWFGLSNLKEFNRKCLLLASNYASRTYSSGRRAQLVEGNFEYWVFRAEPACDESHVSIDGLALHPDHSFWAYGFPPLSPNCGCYVVGAGSERSVSRLGGDLSIMPPDPSAFDDESDAPQSWKVRWLLSRDQSLIALIDAVSALDTGDVGR